MMEGDYKITYDYCDISVAVSGPKGLMVPVVRMLKRYLLVILKKKLVVWQFVLEMVKLPLMT